MMVHNPIDGLMTENNPEVTVMADAGAVKPDVTMTDVGIDAKYSALVAASTASENNDKQMALDPPPMSANTVVVESSMVIQSPAESTLPPPPLGHSRRVVASSVVPKQPFKPYPNVAQRSTSRSLSPSPLPSPSPSLEEEPVRTGVDPRTTYMNRVEGQKNRFLFSDTHNQILETAFQINHSAVSVKVELAQKIGCTELQIVNWFSRRRQREKERLSESTATNTVSKKLEVLEKTSIRSASVPTGTPDEKHAEPAANKSILDEKRVESVAKRAGAYSGQKPSLAEPKPKDERPSLTASDAPRATRPEKPNSEAITGTLGGAEIQKRVSQLVQGGTIIGPEQVRVFISLMNAARDNEGRRSPLNALLMTVRSRSSKAAEISKRFVKENGGLALRKWIEAGKEDFSLPGNKNMLMNTIEIAKALPFDFEALKECKLGVTVKQLAKDDEAQQDLRNSALALEKQWRQLVSSTFDISKLSEKATRDHGGKRAENKRDAPFEAVDMPLPKFIKGKSTGPVELTKKAQIRENAAFFKDIGLTLRTNTGSANSPSSPSQSVSSPSQAVSSPTISAPAPASVTSTAAQALVSTLPSSPSQDSPSSSTITVPSSASDLVSSILANAAVLKMIASKASANSELENSPAVATPVAAPTKLNKPKKTVRFKNPDELVSIRYIDPRPLPGEEEEDSEDEDLAFAGGPGDEDSAMFYLGYGGSSMRPVFMMTEARMVPLLRGDHWSPPLEIAVDEDHQVSRGELSTEKEAQEKRELETLSANYFQVAYIPPSPAEPDPDPVPLDPTTVKPIVLNDGTEVLLGSLKLLEQLTSSSAAPTSAYNPYEGYGQAYGAQYADASQQQQYSVNAAAGSYANLYAGAGTGYTPQLQQDSSYVVPTQQAEATTAPVTAAFPDAQTTLALLQMLQQHAQQPQQQQPTQNYQEQYQQTYQQPQQQATYGQNATYPYYFQNNQPPSSS
ncbi:hypothetical protein EMPS_10358 [Entomortierella parvispora]|uniref:Homeobox domain-containing protein n=1 Tax=Entomortierella parvispora TaxID=205924 RepID=A0A9P3HJS0_9FUNG|nr:hypothetical protein EMPS_10358 [Entomortierella parvispora]